MANTKADISRIHTRGLATPGKKYYRDDGQVFIGTSNGRLKVLDKADNVVTSTNNTISIEKVADANTSNISDLSAALQIASLYGYTVLTYDVDGNITNKDIYTNSSRSVKQFAVVFSYTADNISNIQVTRISDNLTYNKQLAYDVDYNVTSITII